ncbi:hypothetical protein [Pseudomonas sp. PMCC200344]|uniref:hypothetical protein n=1 Tax=Pseudomonas sp. PMCC200344 TaxID=3042028 RepID=UPI0024B38823|nr:hypothetical protein [Pseudomonas sp. PMCC200344]
MEDEVTIEHEGTQYAAPYWVQGDTLTVFLPNGKQRSTELRGLSPESAARQHLRFYVGSITAKKQ